MDAIPRHRVFVSAEEQSAPYRQTYARRLPETSPNQLSAVREWLPKDERADFTDVADEFASGLCATIDGAKRHISRLVKGPITYRTAIRKRFLRAIEMYQERAVK